MSGKPRKLFQITLNVIGCGEIGGRPYNGKGEGMTPKEGIRYLLEQVPEGEPVFILRGRDSLAPETIEHWGVLASKFNVPVEKIVQASDVAEAMRKYPPHRLPD